MKEALEHDVVQNGAGIVALEQLGGPIIGQSENSFKVEG